jgi:hypothetical protein
MRLERMPGLKAVLCVTISISAFAWIGNAQEAGNDPAVRGRTLSKAKADHKSEKKTSTESAGLPEVLMIDAGSEAEADTYYGIGGKGYAPDPNASYVFLKEDLAESQPKFEVRDPEGRTWKVKLGEESQAEVAATRLVGAAGYFTDVDFYLETMTVSGLPRLKRGERFVNGEQVRGARLELESKAQKTEGNWRWESNPFTGTREMNGLRVMMALINNWDVIERNNKIYEVEGQRRYVVADLGASFGRSAALEVERSKGKVKDYEKSGFIGKTTPATVDFAMHNKRSISDLGRGQPVVKNIPRADAHWIGERLSNLSEKQIGDCFRAAGYSAEDVERYTAIVRERIAQLAKL